MPMSSALPWYVLLLPLVSAAVIAPVTRRSHTISSCLSVGAAVIGFACSCIIFASPDARPVEFPWIDLRPAFYVPFGLIIDGLSKTMLLVVTGVGALIHLYSLGYMHDDAGKSRYRSEEHTSELQSRQYLVCRLLLEKKKTKR